MAKSDPPNGRTNLASCIVATIFLIFLLILILIVYFTLFKPGEPRLMVTGVQLPSFSATNGTVSFTFSQYATVNNPNRAVFTHYNSSLELLYAGVQVGFMFIPAGKINACNNEYMAATFSVQSFAVSANRPSVVVWPTTTEEFAGFHIGPSLEIESRVEISGRVRFLHFFTHHADARAECRIDIDVHGGSVLGFHC